MRSIESLRTYIMSLCSAVPIADFANDIDEKSKLLAPVHSRCTIEPWLYATNGSPYCASRPFSRRRAGRPSVRDLAGVRAFDLADGRVAREAGEGIGSQRAADVGAVLARGEARRHQLRIFLLAADAARRRIAACDDLAEHREIWHDAEIALCARKRHAEAGDDLVEDISAPYLSQSARTPAL